MAELVKLQKEIEGGTKTTLYPITPPQAVIDPDTGKSMREELDEKCYVLEIPELPSNKFIEGTFTNDQINKITICKNVILKSGVQYYNCGHKVINDNNIVLDFQTSRGNFNLLLLLVCEKQELNWKYSATLSEYLIPSKTSELENNSNFITKDDTHSFYNFEFNPNGDTITNEEYNLIFNSDMLVLSMSGMVLQTVLKGSNYIQVIWPYTYDGISIEHSQFNISFEKNDTGYTYSVEQIFNVQEDICTLLTPVFTIGTNTIMSSIWEEAYKSTFIAFKCASENIIVIGSARKTNSLVEVVGFHPALLGNGMFIIVKLTLNKNSDGTCTYTLTNTNKTIPTLTSQLTNDSNFITVDDVKELNGALTYVTEIVKGEYYDPTTGEIKTTTANHYRSSKFATLGKFNISMKFTQLTTQGILTAHSWDSKGNYTGSVSQNIDSGKSSHTWNLIPGEEDAYYAVDFIGNDNDSSTIRINITYNYANKNDIPTQTSQLTNDNGFITESDIANKANNIPVVDITEEVWINSGGCELSPNIFYKIINQQQIDIILKSPSDSSIYNEYMIEFTTPAEGTSLILDSSIKWLNGEAPIIEANKTYQISIVNNLAVYGSF